MGGCEWVVPLTIRSGISYADNWEGHSTVFRLSVQEATRVVHVQRNNLEQFKIDMLGESRRIETNITRWPPERHPKWPWLVCVEADELPIALDVPGQSGADSSISYGANDQGLCRVQLTYRTVDWVVVPDEAVAGEADPELQRYVSRYETYATEALPVPGNTFKYTISGTKIPEPGSKFGFTKEVTYVWHEVPYYARDHVEDFIGKANSAIFDAHTPQSDGHITWPARVGYPIGTLLFIAPDVKLGWTAAGLLAYEIAFKFLYRPKGWNFLYGLGGNVANPPGYYEITSADGTGVKLYELADLSDLFQLA